MGKFALFLLLASGPAMADGFKYLPSCAKAAAIQKVSEQNAKMVALEAARTKVEGYVAADKQKCDGYNGRREPANSAYFKQVCLSLTGAVKPEFEKLLNATGEVRKSAAAIAPHLKALGDTSCEFNLQNITEGFLDQTNANFREALRVCHCP